MIYNRRHRFWECLRCGAQFWSDGRKLTAFTEDEKLEIGAPEEVDLEGPVDYRNSRPHISLSYVPSHDAKRRGSSKSGRRRSRKKTKRPRRWGDGLLR